MKTYLTYGIINAIVSALLGLVLYFTGYQTEKIASAEYLGYVGMVIFLVVVFLGMRETRESKPGKAITYGGALGAAVMISLFSGLFAAIYDYIHFTFINTDYARYATDAVRQQLEAKGMSEAQIDSVLKISSMFMKPGIQAIGRMFSFVLFGTIGGLIMAIFLKREPTPPELPPTEPPVVAS